MSTPPLRWFFVQNGRRRGPVDLYGLADLIVKQELPEDALVWHSGLDEWVKASDIPEIRRELPPPIPMAARETGRVAPIFPLRPEPAPGAGEPEAPNFTPAEPEKHRRHKHGHRSSSSQGRWVAMLLVALVVVMMGLWWVLKRINEVPAGRVILREGRAPDPSPTGLLLRPRA